MVMANEQNILHPLNVLLLTLSGHFDTNDERQIRQYLSGIQISKREMETLNDLTAIFIALQERGFIADDNLKFLKDIFHAVKRKPLVEIVEKFEREYLEEPKTTCPTELSPLKRLFDELNGELCKEDEQKIRHLLEGRQISKRDMESLKDPTDMFMKLKESGHIAANEMTFLKRLFKTLSRPQLVKLIEDYELSLKPTGGST
ncbi:caspase-8-like [Glandiceps talaboti]